MRFDLNARWALIWGLMVVFLLSTTSWLAEHRIGSQAVHAQVTNAPGTPPEIVGLQASRTVLSHGRVENARQQTPINPNGLRDVPGFGDPTTGRVGLLTAIATNTFPGTPTPPSSAWQPDAMHITLGWDQRFHKEQLGIGDPFSNPVALASLTIPSCFTLVVAEGNAPAGSGAPGSIPTTVRWESTGPLIGEGNLYASVSIPAAGIVAGDELRTYDQLAAYTANSIIWEAPPFGQIVQDTTLMQFGTKNITAHAVDLSDPANPVIGVPQSATVEVTRTLHVEIEVLGIEENDDGSFSLCAIANLFGNSLEPVTNFWFRWAFAGQTVSLVGDIPGSNLMTIHIPAAEKDKIGELYVVASCSGAVLTSDPFTADPLGVPPGIFVRHPIGLLTFLSGNCTLEDDASVKITPFGECPEAEMMIDEIDSTGDENVWIRTTPAQGEVEVRSSWAEALGKPPGTPDPDITLTENSCTFRQKDDDPPDGSGKTYSNTLTWTPPPERIIDDGIGKRDWKENRYQMDFSVTHNGPGILAYIAPRCLEVSNPYGYAPYYTAINGDPCQSAYQGVWPPVNEEIQTAFNSDVGGTRTVRFDFISPDFERRRRFGPVLTNEVHLSINYREHMGILRSYVAIHWRYEYSKNKSLATVTRDGQELEAQKSMKVVEADRVRTESKCKMSLGITNGKGTTFAKLTASESTEFDILHLALGKPNRFDFAVKSGELRSEVFGERGSTKLTISSPTATATVTGTVFKIGYDEKEQSSTIAVEKGSVLVTPTNASLQPVTLNAGQQVKITQSSVGPVTRMPFSLIRFVSGHLLYIGIGAGALLLIVLSLLIISRGKPRSPTQAGVRQDLSSAATVQPPPAMMPADCDKCGAALKPGKAFCTACGAPRRLAGVTASGTASGAGTAGGAGVGPTPVTQRCVNPQCRQPLVPGKRFCTSCGTRVV